ncbi:MmcQ/YjbR family DNA-binding protein [Marinilabiliaceae bacterium ANBcel2]|nr:MmcQ/YjbR family DNA-binding protein [Marinilabiliaceae bacterium ANBcel2]
MNIEEVRNYCLSFKGAEEKMPFDDSALVFSVKDKMFCLTDIYSFDFINVKCDPDEAIELRAQYEDVTPGYHMNKKHWNSINPQGTISDSLIKEWIKNSYDLVVSKLSKKRQKELQEE